MVKTLSTSFDSLQQIRSDTGLWHDGDRTPIYTSFRCDLRCLSALLLEEYPRSIVCSTSSQNGVFDVLFTQEL